MDQKMLADLEKLGWSVELINSIEKMSGKVNEGAVKDEISDIFTARIITLKNIDVTHMAPVGGNSFTLNAPVAPSLQAKIRS